MSSFSFSKTLRTLGLAAALMSPMVAGSAFAEGEYVAGPTAVGSSTQSSGRTLLAGNGYQTLEQTGATGGGGQHS